MGKFYELIIEKKTFFLARESCADLRLAALRSILRRWTTSRESMSLLPWMTTLSGKRMWPLT
jgi:hypothetical protein